MVSLGLIWAAAYAGTHCARRRKISSAHSFGELGIGVANFAEFAASKTQIRTAAEPALAPEGESGPLSSVLVMGGGYRYFCAQRKLGELLCWGHGEYGQIGSVLGSSPRPMIVPKAAPNP